MAIKEQVEDQLSFLDRFVKGKIYKVRRGLRVKAPQFVIAKRWGSWYPSLFNVEGGCCAIVTREPTRNLIVIDPGFNFLATLNDVVPVEAQDIRNVIVTHMHPDHCAGLMQFLTVAHESDTQCDVFMTETGYNFFNSFQSEGVRIHEIEPAQIYRLAKYTIDGDAEEITFVPFCTYHAEVGFRHRSMGLSIRIRRAMRNQEPRVYKLVLLGDTDGRPEYKDRYLKLCTDANIVMCNLGTYSDLAYGTGYGHLLRSGTESLISDLVKQNNKNLESILISEFGFEMADGTEISTKMLPFYGTRKNQMILLLTSSVLGDGPSCEKKVYSNLLYKSIIDGTDVTNTESLADICFHFEMFLSSLIRVQWREQSLQKKKCWPRSFEDFIDESLPEEEFRKDIDEYAKSTSLTKIKSGTVYKKLDQIISFLLRAIYEQGQIDALEKIMAFCQKMYNSSRTLCESWTILSESEQYLYQERFLHAIESARDLKGEKVLDSEDVHHSLLDKEDTEKIKSISMTDNYKFSMLCFGLIYSIAKGKKDVKMVQEVLRKSAEERQKGGRTSLPLEACRELKESARRKAEVKRTTLPIIPVDKGHIFRFEDQIKVKLATGEWVRPAFAEPAVDGEGHIILIRKEQE